jgi:hypothetical protein
MIIPPVWISFLSAGYQAAENTRKVSLDWQKTRDELKKLEIVFKKL